MFSLFAGISSFSKNDKSDLIAIHNDEALLSPENRQKSLTIGLKNDFNDNNRDVSINSVNINKQSSNKQQILIKPNKCIIFLMSMIVITGPLSTESQVPALQNIKNDFNTTSSLVQLSITI